MPCRVGHNPTGIITTDERRREVYRVCQEHDVVIIEDDPYWFLQFDGTSSHRLPSYLTIDFDSRVIRLDTFSKTIAPGLRLGWITAQREFIERLDRITALTSQPSGLSNREAYRIVTTTDGGLRALMREKCDAYRRRMDKVCDVLSQNQRWSAGGSNDSVDIFTFEKPTAGMYIWIRLHLNTHPRHEEEHTAIEIETLHSHLCYRHFIAVSPGKKFDAYGESSHNLNTYFRFCVSSVSENDVEELAQRLVQGLRAFWSIGHGGMRRVLPPISE